MEKIILLVLKIYRRILERRIRECFDMDLSRQLDALLLLIEVREQS